MVHAIPTSATPQIGTPSRPVKLIGGSADEQARVDDRPYQLPSESDFFSQDYLPAPQIQAIAETLIGQWPELATLEDVQIDYLWKKKGGKSGGVLTRGKCSKASGFAAFYSEKEFIIWIGVDNCRATMISRSEMIALVYHELKHIGIDEDEKTGDPIYFVRPHEVEMFHDEVIRYGLWKPALVNADETFAQLRLPVEER
jgi:hypothetical protein